ncbi:MAG: glycosyltransferase family 4 protein [Bacteroidota bacterium]
MEKQHILLVYNGVLPVDKYGGTGRVVWYLGRELHARGHEVTFLTGRGSQSSFARVIPWQAGVPLASQIPGNVDLVHSHFPVWEELPKPLITTIHGNSSQQQEYPLNTVFVSRDHARRHGSECFVYNGLGRDELGDPDLSRKRSYLHFLGKAAWRVKNLKGAMDIARQSHQLLHVLGGYRLNLKMGLRFTPDPRIVFHGMVGGERKNRLLNGSSALLFPVRWHEPFGLAVIESLYFGCPVIGTPYGALPEIITPETGFLSASQAELVVAAREAGGFNRQWCHDYVCENFSVEKMTTAFEKLYEKVLNGESLNPRPPVLQEMKQEKFLPYFN